MEWKYAEVTRRVIGCAMEVHCVSGPGFPEYVYRPALGGEFERSGIRAEPEFPLPLFFKGVQLTIRRIDFFVEQLFGLEIKARPGLESGDFTQALNYVRAWNLEFGLLINFGGPSLQFRRLENRLNDAVLAERYRGSESAGT